MKISSKGLDLIKEFEGFRAVPYKDAVGLPTIGYGHLIKKGEVFGAISSVEATAILSRDVEDAENSVNKMVNVPINQHQFDALVSFTYNLGGHSLLSSTLLKKLNLKDFEGAAEEFLKWDHAGGKQLPGLTRRRKAEKELFECPA